MIDNLISIDQNRSQRAEGQLGQDDIKIDSELDCTSMSDYQIRL